MSYNPCPTLYYMVRLALWDTLYLLELPSIVGHPVSESSYWASTYNPGLTLFYVLRLVLWVALYLAVSAGALCAVEHLVAAGAPCVVEHPVSVKAP